MNGCVLLINRLISLGGFADFETNSPRLPYHVVQADYRENLTQADIIERLGVLSRLKVSRPLMNTRQGDLVRISLAPAAGGTMDPERRLGERGS